VVAVAPTPDNLFNRAERVYVFATPAAAKGQVKPAEEGWSNTGAPEHTKVVGPYLLEWEKLPPKAIASKVEACLAE
jgi:hypothetical protein